MSTEADSWNGRSLKLPDSVMYPSLSPFFGIFCSHKRNWKSCPINLQIPVFTFKSP